MIIHCYRYSLPLPLAVAVAVTSYLLLIAVVLPTDAFSPCKPRNTCRGRLLTKITNGGYNRNHQLSMSAGEMHTGYEWLARQRKAEAGTDDDPVGRIRWMDIGVNSNNNNDQEEVHQLADDDGDDDDDDDELNDGEARDSSIPDREETNNDVLFEESTGQEAQEDVPVLRVPLYPLGAVHIPSGHVQTLNNMQPQNIRMAQDLIRGAGGGSSASAGSRFLGQENSARGSSADTDAACSDGRFCVTLRAADTGRIATTGTLMRVVHTEELKSYDGSLLGIRVQCVAEGLVEITGIVNPQCWTRERRLRKSDEYLVANVRPIAATTCDGDADIGEFEDIAKRLADDYTVVRSMYASKGGVAARELPSWAVDAVQNNLPALQARNFTASEQSFWRAADVWQTLCNTVREARRSDLQSEVNEITIDAAIKKGGPLKLPVHRSDLPQDVRLRLNQMEEEAAKEYVALGMDPVLDFQALMSANGQLNRIQHLSGMVARERRRLEAKESLKVVFDESEGEQLPEREDAVVVGDGGSSGNDPYNATHILEGIFE